MAEFGWAHINSSALTASGGPPGSVQYAYANQRLTGSQNLVYKTGSATLHLTGNMIISGTLQANVFDVLTTTKTEIEIGGSSHFGNDSGDTHIFTGSVSIVSGAFNRHYLKLTTNAAIELTDYPYASIIGVSASAYQSITLQSASVAGAGQVLVIKDEWSDTRTDAKQIAVSASTGDSIDHASSYTLSGDSPALSIYSDGISKWFIY
mgnify:FL=1|jgi:hypothetical protein